MLIVMTVLIDKVFERKEGNGRVGKVREGMGGVSPLFQRAGCR